MNQDDRAVLRQSHFLQGLKPQLFDQLVGISRELVVSKGTLIFQQGDPGNCFYAVLSGWVRLFRQTPSGEEAVIHVFSRSETFAEVVAFGDHTYPVSADAVTDLRLAAFERSAFVKAFRADPDIGLGMLGAMSRRLHYLVADLEQHKTVPAPKRLGRFLLHLSRSHDYAEVIDLPFEKNLIAARLGMTPESLSRAFLKLKKYGVQINGSQVSLTDFTRLSQFVGLV